MKKSIALYAGAALCLLAIPASAADVAVSTYANPFNGFYVGVHGGYGWANSDIDYNGNYNYSLSEQDGPYPFDGKAKLNMDGALLGAQAGANFVMDNGLLLGAEVSGSWAAMNGDDSLTGGVENDINLRVKQDLDAIGLAQVKLGFASDAWAIYGMGGLALGHMNTTTTIGSNDNGLAIPGSQRFSDDETLTGWTIGAGADYMVSEHVSIGVSYNYIDFGKSNSHFDVNTGDIFGMQGSFHGDDSVKVNVVKASLNYHF